MSIELTTTVNFSAVKEIARNHIALQTALLNKRTAQVEALSSLQQKLLTSLENNLADAEKKYMEPESARQLNTIRSQCVQHRARLDQIMKSAQEEESFMEQDVSLEKQVAHESSQHLKQISERMVRVRGVAQETEELMLEQGEKVDDIATHCETVLINAGEANKLLAEGQKEQRKCSRGWLGVGIGVVALLLLCLLLIA